VSWARRGHSAAHLVERLGPLLIIAGALTVWEFAASYELIASTFFPQPTLIARSLWRLIATGDVVVHSAVTLGRTLGGFGIGAGSGLLLGLAMGAWPRLNALLDPIVALIHPIPKVAVLPLVLVVFGIGEASKIALGALGCFFPMLINTVAGVRTISPTYFEVARSYGAGKRAMFLRVVLPGSLPMVLTGARLALNMALVLVIAGELLVAQRGLGQMMWFSWQTMRIADVYAWLVVTGFIGVMLNWILARIATWAMPWRSAGGSVSG
jgi:NitT/TauT family transport system permease protein